MKFLRKKDKQEYETDLVERLWPGKEGLGSCYLLRPAWSNWDGREHYKTVMRFKDEYLNTDLSPIE